MRPLYTWRDVERFLARADEAPWRDVVADNESLVIHCLPEQRESALGRLREVFGGRFSEGDGRPHVELAAAPGSSRRLQVVFDEEELAPRRPRAPRPLWSESGRSITGASPFPEGSPRLAAFYSFKGGVGRTTVLLATLGKLLDREKPARVLVVDADMEAPGLTFQIPGTPDRFTLLDYLALVHDADDWRKEALPIAADRLSAPLPIELGIGRRELYFLPAFEVDRVPDEPSTWPVEEALFSRDLLPEHLVRRPGRSFVVGDALCALGAALEVDVVLIDLRAGVNELSSPLMLDPRVHRVLVSACSNESFEGTRHVLRRVLARAGGPRPDVVLNMIPEGLDVTEQVGMLQRELTSEEQADAAEELATPNVREVPFAQELLGFHSIEELLVRKLPGTSLYKETAQDIASFFAPEDIGAPVERPSVGLAEVAALADSLEYAESNTTLRMLPTPALTALVDGAREALPAAVVLGAKGAGKTYAWGQMVIAGRWRAFAEAAGQGKNRSDALIFPLLSPVNVRTGLAETIRHAESAVRAAVGTSDGEALSEVQLRRELADEQGTRDGLAFWYAAIARRLGLQSSDLRGIVVALEARNVAVCLVVDGLEDAFQLAPNERMNEGRRSRLRALLVDLTSELRDMRSPRLGIVTFLRRDLAQAAIPQNFGQFEKLHSSALSWTPLEALRLVAWILDLAGFLSLPQLEHAPYERLRDELAAFWNRRMGGERSKEAYTDLWVIAALSDYQGRLQARDLVRLVAYAADESAKKGNERLTPTALRSALERCSDQKIEELATETPGLQGLFDKLKSGDARDRKMPFRPEAFALSPEEVHFLETHGIAARGDQGELFLPEIIRRGLGFKLEGGRRPAVLKMHRQSQRRSR